MTADQLMQAAGLLVLILLSGFFSGSETALMSLDRLRLAYLVEKKRPGARKLESLLDNPDRLLGTLLVGNNIVNIAISVFATTLLVELYAERAEFLTILIVTPLLLIFGEVSPKTFAARRSETVAFWVLRPMLLAMSLLKPLVWLVSGVSRLVNKCFAADAARPAISGDEIRSMISVGEQSGTVHKEQRRMLHGVFDLAEIRVRDVMIPRTEVVGIEVDTSFAETLALVRGSMHSRFPVYEENLDRIVGVIHSKDILGYVDRPETFSLRTLARPPYFVPEAKRIETLLQSFRRRRVHLAVVVDEYGGVEGIVTLEDIVEEIVGEIRDEYDVEEVLVRELAPGSFLIDGSASLRSINRRFKLHLSEEHATTLAGFLLRTFGTIPAAGESCTAQGVRFVVRKVVERRIEEIEMTLPEPSAAG
ncbi:MAG: transporter [Desulfuromonadales bacterium GWC2_61_20]|nr:MAG: transporter [Desulfuromonadales bacterium GWC2_61_20]HAD03240.1 transporter [Desulfuromonas sp.]HBT82549.1 transporter [Desulfuromonas sp.]